MHTELREQIIAFVQYENCVSIFSHIDYVSPQADKNGPKFQTVFDNTEQRMEVRKI